MFWHKLTRKSRKWNASMGGRPVRSRTSLRDWSRHARFETLENRYLLSAAPTPLGLQFQVNQNGTAGGAGTTAIASDPAGDHVVVWGVLNHAAEVYAQRYDASGAIEGSQILVAAPPGNSVPFPSVAMDAAGDFVVAWESSTGEGLSASPISIYAQRYNAMGVAQGSEIVVNSGLPGSVHPSVAMDSAGDFVIAFEIGDNEIVAQRYNAAGAPQGSEFVVDASTTRAVFNPVIAMDSAGDFIAAWEAYGQNGSNTGIAAQRYNAAGVPQGSEFFVNTYTGSAQSLPSIAADPAGDFVIAWTSISQDGSAGGIYAQRYGANGAAQESEFQVNTYTTGDQNVPSVAMDSAGDFVVTWQSTGNGGSDNIYAQAYTAAGATSGGQFQVNSDNTTSQLGPAVAMDGVGNFTVAWLGGNGLSQVFARNYSGNFVVSAAGSEFQVNTYTTSNEFTPAIAADSAGDYVIAWNTKGEDGSGYAVYAQRYNSSGAAQGSEFLVGAGDEPSVAMDSAGDFVISWTVGDHFGAGSGNIFAQRYNTAGAAQGSQFQVNSDTSGASRNYPSVAMDSAGDFVVTWEFVSNGVQNYDVRAQRYNAAGAAQGSEFVVNTYTTGDQQEAHVAMDSAGDFVVTWLGGTGKTNGNTFVQNLYAQRFDSSGTARGSSFQVNTYTTGGESSPRIAMDSAGDFVVVWEGIGPESSGGALGGNDLDINAQLFNASGVAQGSEFRVNTYTAGPQQLPSVSMDSAGDFVVTWASYGQDGSAYGIYAQQYDTAGTALGSEFRVNTYTSGNQDEPSVAMDSTGDFVVAWDSAPQDGSGEGIFAQRYSVSQQQSPSPFSQQGTTLTIDGESLVGPFFFEFETATKFDFTYNGTTYFYDTAHISQVIFNGVAGANPEVVFYDPISTDSYAANQSFSSTKLNRTGGVAFEFDANNATTFYAYVANYASTATVKVAGGVGANFYVDAQGNYSYIADPIQGIYSELSGFGPETVIGAGGSTYAYVYSTSLASFVGDPNGSTFTTSGTTVLPIGTIFFDGDQSTLELSSTYTATFTGFPQVYVIGASDGGDSVTLHTAGGSFVGTPSFSSVSGTFNGQTFLIGALYAAHVTAQATNPTDSAFFYSSAGDTFNGTTGAGGSTLSGSAAGFASFSTFVSQAIGFQSVTVMESGTGSDVANLTSPGNGTFNSTPTVSTLAIDGVTVFTVLTSFMNTITAGSSSTTIFTAVPATVNFIGSSDGSDTANLYDGDGDNDLVADGDDATLTRARNRVTTSEIGYVLAYQTLGTNDEASVLAIDYTLQLIGDWKVG